MMDSTVELIFHMVVKTILSDKVKMQYVHLTIDINCFLLLGEDSCRN